MNIDILYVSISPEQTISSIERTFSQTDQIMNSKYTFFLSSLKRISALLLLSSLLSGCAALYPQFIKTNDKAAVSIDRTQFNQAIRNNGIGSLVVVPASINGISGFEFALDTGAATTVIFDTVKTRELNISTQGEYEIGGSGSGEKALAKIAMNVDLSIGGATIHKMSPLIMNWEDAKLFASEDGVYIDGIIGFDLFDRFAVEVNPQAETVRLFEPSSVTSLESGMTSLPIEMALMSRQVYTNIDVLTSEDEDSFSQKVHLDTGATNTLSLTEGENGIKIDGAATKSSATGLQGKSSRFYSEVSAIELAGFSLSDVPISIVPQENSKTDKTARLGASVMQRFRYVIDYQNDRILLEPQTIDKEFSKARFGISAVPTGEHMLVRDIDDTDAGFQAGLRNGDKIISFNGLGVDEFGFRELANLEPKLGDKMTVCFVREALKEQCLDVVAASI